LLRSLTSPRVAGSSPARIFSRVDFPQPEGPTMATNSPSATLKSISSTATTVPRGVPYSLRKPFTAITSADRPMAPPECDRFVCEMRLVKFVEITGVLHFLEPMLSEQSGGKEKSPPRWLQFLGCAVRGRLRCSSSAAVDEGNTRRPTAPAKALRSPP